MRSKKVDVSGNLYTSSPDDQLSHQTLKIVLLTPAMILIPTMKMVIRTCTVYCTKRHDVLLDDILEPHFQEKHIGNFRILL